MAVRILTDSASELSAEFCKKNNIEFLAIPLEVEGKSYMSGENFLVDNFYAIARKGELPKTSLINEYRFSEVFDDVKQKGDEMVVVVLSKELSGTYQQAINAKQHCGYEKIFVPDHLTITIAQAALVLEAIKMRDSGASAEQINNRLLELSKKVRLMAYVSQLNTLRSTGRLSGVAALIGTLLNIKPSLSLEQGKLFSRAKSFGIKKAQDFCINELLKSELDKTMPVFIAHIDDNQNAIEVEQKLNNKGVTVDGGIWPIGSTVGAHVGLGACAIVWFVK